MRNGLRAVLAVAFVMVMPAQAEATKVAGHVRVAISSAAATADFSTTAERRDFVILHEWERRRAQELKAANPSLKVLLYQNLSGMMARDKWGNASTGLATQDAAAHDDWYLRNTQGQRFTFKYYSWVWAADIGNADYQRAWADAVIAKLDAGVWDGVFVDDTNPTIRHHYDVARVAKYPTDAAYGAATGSALAAIGPRIRARGKLVIPNFGSWRAYRDVVDGWLPHVSGAMDEMFGKWGATRTEGYIVGNEWERQLGALKVAESMGKFFLGISHSDDADAAAARYGWGTMLLAADGHSSFALHADYTNESWFEDYELRLGAPLGPAVREASGVHRRAFSSGLVIVNPTSSPVPVSFGGRYSGSGLTNATSTVLAPASAVVVERSGTDIAPEPGPQPNPEPDPGPDPEPGPIVPPTPPLEPVKPPKPVKPPRQPKPSVLNLATAGAPAGPGTGDGRPAARVAVRVRVTCTKTRACRQRLVLRAKGRRAVLGRRAVTLAAGRSARVRVPLNRRARRLLRRKGRIAAVVTRDGARAAAVTVRAR